MEAYKKDINDIFPRNKLLEIPFYQRSYVWGREEWERLLEDLKDMCERKEEYFLGSVILKDTTIPGPNEEGFAGKFVVVDGQQRLTSLLIMMKVIALKNDDSETFDDYFVCKSKTKDTDTISLRHNRKDRPHFETILHLDTLADVEGDAGVIGAYNFFRREIDDQTAALMDLATLIRLMAFVKITVTEIEDEQQIFDTINSLGVTLTTAELLKNYFFNSSNADRYETHWESVFESDDETRTYWDREIITGRYRRSMIDVFFDSYLQIAVESKNLGVRDEDKKAYQKVDKLFHSYRDFIKKYLDGNTDSILDDIKSYAETFRSTFDPDACTRSVGAEPGLDRINVVIFGLQSSTLIPYILHLKKNVTDGAELKRMLHALESYFIRRMVSRETTKNYNRFFESLIRDEVKTFDELKNKLANTGDTTTALPDLTVLEQQFKEEQRLTNLQSRGVLYLVEASKRDTKRSATALLGLDAYSLEHMMPKKWRNNWDLDGTDDQATARDRVLLTLGNLAIVPQSLNGSISDSNWDVKKAGKPGKPGLAECAAGLVTMQNALTASRWDESTIYERAETLGAWATEIWSFE